VKLPRHGVACGLFGEATMPGAADHMVPQPRRMLGCGPSREARGQRLSLLIGQSCGRVGLMEMVRTLPGVPGTAGKQ